jgi:hypothetical protein
MRWIANFATWFALLAAIIGCSESIDDQPELRLTDPPAQNERW